MKSSFYPHWRLMKTAPKTREVIFKIYNAMLGKHVAVMGCWLIPDGAPDLAGWHAGSAVTGSRSIKPGVPFKIIHSSIDPVGWMDMPITSPEFW